MYVHGILSIFSKFKMDMSSTDFSLSLPPDDATLIHLAALRSVPCSILDGLFRRWGTGCSKTYTALPIRIHNVNPPQREYHAAAEVRFDMCVQVNRIARVLRSDGKSRSEG